MNAYLTVINRQLAIIHGQGPWAQVLTSWWDTKHSGLSITRAALASQNITNNIWLHKIFIFIMWPLHLAHKLKNTWRLRAGEIRTTTFQKPFHCSQFLDTWGMYTLSWRKKSTGPCYLIVILKTKIGSASRIRVKSLHILTPVNMVQCGG